MKSFECLVKRRKSEFNRQPLTNNFSVDGFECLAKHTSPKSMFKLADLANGNAQRVPRTNSIQNLVQTCKNSQRKHVRFEDIVLKPQASNNKEAELSLFTQMCNSKDKRQDSVSSDRDETRLRFVNPKIQKTVQKAEINSNRNTDEKTQKSRDIEEIASEVNDDSEKFLRQSTTNLTKQEEKCVREQVMLFKEKTFTKLKQQTQSMKNIENLLIQVKGEINNEIDRLIDQTLCKRKNLYKLAQEQVQAYFSKLDSKKRSPGTQKTHQSTPCFDGTHSNSRKQKGTHEKCTVRAFDTSSGSKNRSTPMSSAREELNHLLIDTIRSKENPKTNDKKVESSNESKGHNNSSRFTFTVGSRGKDTKTTKTTKRIKDSIISGRHNISNVTSPPDHESVTVNEFNL